MTQRPRLALVAHDSKKDDMVAFCAAHADFLERCEIVSTGTTGGLITAANPELRVRRVKSGPLGGDQQIGALIAEGMIDAILFLVDPLTPMPHDVDVKALMRLAIVYDIPMALNVATAEIVLAGMRQSLTAA